MSGGGQEDFAARDLRFGTISEIVDRPNRFDERCPEDFHFFHHRLVEIWIERGERVLGLRHPVAVAAAVGFAVFVAVVHQVDQVASTSLFQRNDVGGFDEALEGKSLFYDRVPVVGL